MSRSAALVLIASVATAGCSSAFQQTDELYHPHRGKKNPKVFLDRLPARAYKSVGFIEISGGGPLRYVISRAMEEGRFVGCELLVPEELHRLSMGLPGARMLLSYNFSQSAPPPTPTPIFVGPSAPPERFICGIYVSDDETETGDAR